MDVVLEVSWCGKTRLPDHTSTGPACGGWLAPGLYLGRGRSFPGCTAKFLAQSSKFQGSPNSTWKVPAALRKLSTAFSSPSAVLRLCLVPIFEEQQKVKNQENISHLCVKPPNVEEDCSSLKSHGLLGARHSRQRVIPERESGGNLH